MVITDTDLLIYKFQIKLKVKVKILCRNSISQLRSVTCFMGSHSVTCHPT